MEAVLFAIDRGFVLDVEPLIEAKTNKTRYLLRLKISRKSYLILLVQRLICEPEERS